MKKKQGTIEALFRFDGTKKARLAAMDPKYPVPEIDTSIRVA